MTDDIIKRLREAIAEHPLSPIHGYAADIAALLDRLAEADEMRDALLRNGFVECDIPACNCGSWHHRYGLPERMREIKAALSEAGHELSNENGNLTINALNALVAERDELLDRLEAAERENDGHRQAQASIFRAIGQDANPDRATWAETITALAADARRYRWLTDNCGVEMEDGTLGIEFWSDPENWNDLDNAIDAARAAERGKE